MTRKIKKSLSCTKNLGTIKSKLLMIMFVIIIATPIVFGGTILAENLAEYQEKCAVEFLIRQAKSFFNNDGNSSSALNNLMNATPGNNHTVSDETVYNQMKYVVDRFRNPYSSSDCNDTCDSLGYRCGTHTICGVEKGCGSCDGEDYCENDIAYSDHTCNSETCEWTTTECAHGCEGNGCCTPDCPGECGPDGCGGTCGTCQEGWTCNEGTCEANTGID